METLRWDGRQLLLLDQTKLPEKVTYVNCRTAEQVADAILNMQVRGAPAIGAAAAYGMVLAAKNYSSKDKEVFLKNYLKVKKKIKMKNLQLNLSLII